MPTVQIPAGSRIFLQSAIEAAQDISAISKANPGVVTYSGADPSDDDYVILQEVAGMIELEGSLVKVANVDGPNDTFELKDQDTSGYQDFIAAKMRKVTLATEVSIASGLNMSGGEQQFADYQYLREKIARKVPTTQTAVEIGIPAIWDPADPSMAIIRNAADTNAELAIKILFPNGVEILALGFVGASGLPNVADLASVVTTEIKFALSGSPRYILPSV